MKHIQRGFLGVTVIVLAVIAVLAIKSLAPAANTISSVKTVADSICAPKNYSVKNGVMHWGANPINEADPATFEVLPQFPDDGGFDLCLSQDATHLFSTYKLVAPRPRHIRYLPLQGTNNCKVYRVVGGVGVFHGVSLLAGSDAATFVDMTAPDHDGHCYGKDKNQIYSAYGVNGYGPIVGGDPRTFTVLSGTYAKDASHVWNGANIIQNADANTFVALGDVWAKDKNNVYWHGRVTKGANSATFVAIDDSHGKDATHAFDAPGNTLTHIADIESLVSIRNDYWLKDKVHVYTSNGQILEQADPLTFVDLGAGYAKDAVHIFYYGDTGVFSSGMGHSVPDAHVKSFKVELPNYYGKDDAHIFSEGKILEGADVHTFSRIGRSAYFKDTSHVWYSDGGMGIILIPEADAATFAPTDTDPFGGAADANYGYGFSAKGAFFVGKPVGK